MAKEDAPQPKKRATLGAKGQITIPSEIRARAGLEPGEAFEVELVPGGILLRSHRLGDLARDASGSEEWQDDDEFDTGYDQVPKTDRDFFESLEL